MRRRISKERQRGAAMVEMAIILPLLLLLVFGIIEFSVMFYDKAMLTNASREGARLGVLFNHPDDIPNADIEARVREYAEAHVISFDGNSQLVITVNREPDGDMRFLTVTVNYGYGYLVIDNIVGLFGGSLDPINLSAVTVMRMEKGT
jgi:Flp pilus assembly protein TadG